MGIHLQDATTETVVHKYLNKNSAQPNNFYQDPIFIQNTVYKELGTFLSVLPIVMYGPHYKLHFPTTK